MNVSDGDRVNLQIEDYRSINNINMERKTWEQY
jgi:hypothetical protein